jgi:hypothetical protein
VFEFRAAVENRDLARMEAALAPDVLFRSPAVFKPYEGRDAVMHLLGTVIEVFEDFEYTDELIGEGTHALVFRARVGERMVEGLDHLTVDADGLVTELVVMIRPLSGLMALAEAMADRLGAPS